MAGEVKSIINGFIKETNLSEFSIEDLQQLYPQFNRVDIISALKQLESEGCGALCFGRRGKSTRFIKNAHRIKINIDEVKLSLLREKIKEIQNDGFISVKEVAENYFQNNINLAIESLKLLEIEGFGVFLIGRRGAISRFVVGGSRNKIVKEKKPIVKVETAENIQTIKYKLINGIIINAIGCDDGFDSLSDLCVAENLSISNFQEIENAIKTSGYFTL